MSHFLSLFSFVHSLNKYFLYIGYHILGHILGTILRVMLGTGDSSELLSQIREMNNYYRLMCRAGDGQSAVMESHSGFDSL